MKKVVFSVTKQGRYENTKTTGVGYITDTDLITACISKAENRISGYSKTALKTATRFQAGITNTAARITRSVKSSREENIKRRQHGL